MVKLYSVIPVLLFLPLLSAGQTQGIVAPACASNIRGTSVLTWTIGQTIASTSYSRAADLILSPVLNERMIIAGREETPAPENQPHIYPNPVSVIVNIDLGAPSEAGLDIELADASGRLIGKYQLAPAVSFKEIDVHGLNPGMYYLRFRRGSVYNVYKFIKL